jgi:hypothetical protein
MAKGRSPSPDGILTEFYSKFWDTLGAEFTTMLQQAIAQGALSAGMIASLITLLPKEGDRERLANWQPITLLNSSYKIFAKVLQVQL